MTPPSPVPATGTSPVPPAPPTPLASARLPRRAVGPVASGQASQRGWDDLAEEYLADRAAHLGDASGAGFTWGPEGLTEDVARLLGAPGTWRGRRIAEVGSGAAQCARWLARHHGADVVALDVSHAMLAGMSGHRDPEASGEVVAVQADAAQLPLRTASMDAVVTAHGALAFHGDLHPLLHEIARILRPGGRFVASLPHPIRWMFPDDPTAAGLTAVRSYFETLPYAEADADGSLTYVEHHHTLGHILTACTTAGLSVTMMHEPRWHAETAADYAGWSEVTVGMAPRTLILSATRTH